MEHADPGSNRPIQRVSDYLVLGVTMKRIQPMNPLLVLLMLGGCGEAPYEGSAVATAQLSRCFGVGVSDRGSPETRELNANLSLVRREYFSDAAMTQLQWSTAFRYDEAGDLVEGLADWDGDGTSDYRESWERGDEGRVDAYTTESPIGEVLVHETWTYDAASHLIEVHTERLGDGSPDELDVFSYDSDGRLVLEEKFLAPPTVPNWLISHTYLVPAPGLDRVESTDWGADGTIDHESTYLHDERGLVVHVDTWDHLSGESVIDHRYDAEGRVVETTSIGESTAIQKQWSYTKAGLLHVYQSHTDMDLDGLIDRTSKIAWSWDCD